MADFPVANYHKPVIGSHSLEACGLPLMCNQISVAASTVWPSANQALYVPFALAGPYVVNKVWWANGATVGNGTADCGVYTADGTRLFSATPQTTAGANVVQSFTITAFLLAPGSYYMALSLSSASDTILRVPLGSIAGRNGQPFGMAQQSSAGTLPATAILGSPVVISYFPIFGIASALVI